MARQKKKRRSKKMVYVFVEGVTEKTYFDALRQQLRLTSLKMEILKLDNAGCNWVEKSLNQMRNNPNYKRESNTEVFVVFDKDQLKKTQFDTMLSLAKRNDISIIFSNISFELWLLAHFEPITTANYSLQKTIEKLSQHLSEKYIKANVKQIDRLIDNYSSAISNTTTVLNVAYDKQGTNVAEMINKLKNNS
ncbi:RloB family protein [Leuconostoc suionicum]|uniref:RloB family protein n=1 Tax=Leuconostoc suionicum TaxID=1511761 RepID=UPI0028D20724|nr:RloB family protein [Leuconostoc suionicum]